MSAAAAQPDGGHLAVDGFGRHRDRLAWCGESAGAETTGSATAGAGTDAGAGQLTQQKAHIRSPRAASS